MTPRILCVDDSATIRKLVQKALEPANVEVFEAANGRIALEMADTSYDMFLVDVNMPEMDGFQFVEEIRSRPGLAEKPVVFLTTESSEEKKERAKALKVSGWIVKPFKSEDLRNIVLAFTGK